MSKHTASSDKTIEQKNSSNNAAITPPGASHTIREFCYEDIATVIKISRIYFPQSRLASEKYLHETIEQLFFNPTQTANQQLNSLVSVDKEGTVTGFLGVQTKRFSLKGLPLVAGHCQHLMATGEARSALIPLKMLQRFISGPQDFSFADGSSDSTRMLWKRLGGEISFSNSIYYKVPMRPFLFVSRALQTYLPNALHYLLRHTCQGADLLVGKTPYALPRRLPFKYSLKPIAPETIAEGLHKMQRYYTLFPEVSVGQLEESLELLRNDKRKGTLHHIGMYNSRNTLAGLFIYFSIEGGVCEVQMAASLPGLENELYNGICIHAYEQGGIELSGRVMPSQIGTSFTLKSLTIPGRMWTLFHTHNMDIRHAMQSDKAFISRIEGDLWLI